MDYLAVRELRGDTIRLTRTDPRHLGGFSKASKASAASNVAAVSPEADFGELLARAFNQVNELQHNSMELGQRLITDPESIDIHDVTIAMAEANLSLSMTKAIVDRALRAYKEIISTR
ncbi:MAG TPA: flagellar hook-basal body complex protein FliE [Spirochaetales bacterium]|nr:flagellar hook-basal body complex protein FliE [Spirochaetales bacterium]